MRRELDQLPNLPISNNPPNDHQPPGLNYQSNVSSKNLQFENTKVIPELKSYRILMDPYQDQVREASTDASQNKNLEELVSTETNHIEEPKPGISTDASSSLNEIEIREKRIDDLPETYKPNVLFPSTLEAGSSYKNQKACNEISMELFKQDHINLPPELKPPLVTIPAPIESNLTPKTPFMSILEEQIGVILNKHGSENGIIKYIPKINSEYINNGIINQLSEIGNPKPLEFVNPIFDTG